MARTAKRSVRVFSRKGITEISVSRPRSFKRVRNPAIFTYEYPENMRGHDGHLKEEFKFEGTAHVYEERFKYLSEVFGTLEDKTLEAQVEWGSEYAEVIIPLRKCRVELQITLQDFIEAKKPGFAREERMTIEERHKQTSIMYYLGETPSELDSFTPQINAAIDKFENRLRPLIGKRKG